MMQTDESVQGKSFELDIKSNILFDCPVLICLSLGIAKINSSQ